MLCFPSFESRHISYETLQDLFFLFFFFAANKGNLFEDYIWGFGYLEIIIKYDSKHFQFLSIKNEFWLIFFFFVCVSSVATGHSIIWLLMLYCHCVLTQPEFDSVVQSSGHYREWSYICDRMWKNKKQNRFASRSGQKCKMASCCWRDGSLFPDSCRGALEQGTGLSSKLKLHGTICMPLSLWHLSLHACTCFVRFYVRCATQINSSTWVESPLAGIRMMLFAA